MRRRLMRRSATAGRVPTIESIRKQDRRPACPPRQSGIHFPKTAIMIRPLTCPVCDKPLSPAMSAASKPQTVSGDAGSSGAVTETDADAEMCQTRASNCLPFCSERCRKIDLFRWFDGRYALRSGADHHGGNAGRPGVSTRSGTIADRFLCGRPS